MEENFRIIRQRIDRAAKRAGRDPQSIRLVGICKQQPVESIRRALALGVTDLGENYVQAIKVRKNELAADFSKACWHFVGHLQTNKVADLLKLFSDRPPLIHTLDRESLAAELNRRGEKQNMNISCLIQILADGADPSERSGIPADQVLTLLQTIKSLKRISVMGLMILPPVTDEPEASRKHFRFLRNLSLELSDNREWSEDPRFRFADLSMGMTHDFETAVEEGATLIRVGEGLFGKRKSP